MEYFEQKLEQVKQREELPSWVSESNASYKAWKATEKKKGERIIYIKNHSKEFWNDLMSRTPVNYKL